MSAPDTNAFQNWWKNAVGSAVPWLAGGPNGQAEAKAWPAVLDYFVQQMVYARYQSFPDYCAVDALQHIGNDRKLIQGANESNASFQTRCKDPWSQWARAGTPCAVLEQLAYYGMTGAVWVQQNGLKYTLSAPPTPGVDPTSLVVASNLDATTGPLTSSAYPYRTIPAGTPWFAFDGNTDMCNRFAIIVPTWPFSALVQANFVNTDIVTIAWPWTFQANTYGVIVGPPSDSVTVWASSPQTGFIDIRASAPWTGSVWVIGFAAGVNPLNIWTPASAGAVKTIISTFRPNALCMGVTAINGAELWDYPAGLTWDGDSNPWDSTTPFSFQVLGAF